MWKLGREPFAALRHVQAPSANVARPGAIFRAGQLSLRQPAALQHAVLVRPMADLLQFQP
jgi:hypothetical protein